MRMYQLSDGVDRAYLPGDPVGLLINSAAPLDYGPELRGLVGATSAGTPPQPPAYDPVTGRGVVSRSDSSNIGGARLTGLTIGALYEVVIEKGPGEAINLRQGSLSGSLYRTLSDTRAYTVYVSAVSSTLVISTGSVTPGVSFTLRSVRQVLGPVFATQPTALSRPTLARWPKGGRRNLSDLTGGLAASGATLTQSGNAFHFTAPGSGIDSRSSVGSRITALNGDVLTTSFDIDTSVPSGAVDLCIGRAFSNRARVTLSVPVAGGPPVLGEHLASPGYFTLPTSTLEHLEGPWWRVSVTTACVSAEPSLNVVTMFWKMSTQTGDVDIRLRKLQLEYGPVVTPYQLAVTANDVTEEGVPDVWHLYNDGGDSLPTVLPGGSYEIAWVTHLGAVHYATVTSDGTAGTDLLRAERMADVITRAGTFTATEKTALEAYWRQRYAA